MGKRYLNAAEKSDVIRLVTFFDSIDQIANAWAERGKDKTLVKYLRMSKSLIDKVNISIIKSLDDDAANALQKYAKNLRVNIEMTETARKSYKEAMEMERVVPMRVDDLYELVSEVSGEYCRLLCRRQGEAVKACKAREIMLRYDVPLANESAGDGECPYRL